MSPSRRGTCSTLVHPPEKKPTASVTSPPLSPARAPLLSFQCPCPRRATADEQTEGGATHTAGPTQSMPASTSTMTAIEVQVKRRETERQQQARLNSFAYMQQQEQEEPWEELQASGQLSRGGGSREASRRMGGLG